VIVRTSSIVIALCLVACTRPPQEDKSPSLADLTCKDVKERLRIAPEGTVDGLGDCIVKGHTVIVTVERTMFATSPDELQERFQKLKGAQESARASLSDPRATVVLVSDRRGKLMSSDEME
jgi:hypothetical protein